MNEIKQYLLAAAVFFCLLLGAAGSWLVTHSAMQKLTEQNADLTARNQALQAAQEALFQSDKTRTTLNAATATRTTERQHAIDSAAASEPDWANQRVPDSIAAALGLSGDSQASATAATK